MKRFDPYLHLRNHMSEKKITGRGRLVPTLPTGVQYEVQYGIHVVPEPRQHGRGLRPTKWEKCQLHAPHAKRIPDGTYFLHTDDGRVHQVRSVNGEWCYLTVAA